MNSLSAKDLICTIARRDIPVMETLDELEILQYLCISRKFEQSFIVSVETLKIHVF